MKRKHTVSINPVSTVSSRLVLGMILIGTFSAVQAADFNCSLSDNGNWTDSNNWSNCGGGIPNNNGQKYDVTLGSGKNVTVNQAIKVDAFSLSSGSLNGNSC